MLPSGDMKMGANQTGIFMNRKELKLKGGPGIREMGRYPEGQWIDPLVSDSMHCHLSVCCTAPQTPL